MMGKLLDTLERITPRLIIESTTAREVMVEVARAVAFAVLHEPEIGRQMQKAHTLVDVAETLHIPITGTIINVYEDVRKKYNAPGLGVE